jgi:cysteine-rich repeat protein
MKHPVYVIPVVSALLLACKGDGSCPVGTVRLGGECIADGQSGGDGSVPDIDAAARSQCGDGQEDEGEACDDGNDTDGDGCSSQCALENACANDACAPAAPTLRGAPSMAPGRELWTWTVPEGATRIELRLDGEPIATPDAARLSPSLSEGDHALEARACNDDGCSAWAVHNTIVEAFGQTLPLGLTDTARKLTRTSLGHAVAIGCERCLSDADGNALVPAATVSALERAIHRASDVVAFAIASVDGELHVTTKDVAKADGLTRLRDVLAQPLLRDGDALVLLDIVENEPRLSGAVTPKVLAESLRSALEAAPLVARNGRPLLVRGTYANRGYLSELRDALVDVPEVGPYVRYVVRDPEGAVGDFYSLGATSSGAPLVQSLDFVDAVSFGYTAPDLPNRITLSRRAGRAVIIEGVPGSGERHGHALITALRDQADVIITRYQANRAQSLVGQSTRELYFDVEGITATKLSVWYDNASGTAIEMRNDLADVPDQVGVRPPLPRTEADSWSGLQPPSLDFISDFYRSVSLPRSTLVGSLDAGFLAAAFGAIDGWTSLEDGRAQVTLSPSQPAVVNIFVTLPDDKSQVVTLGDDAATRACGRSITSLLAPGVAHWWVAYTSGTVWTVLVDGACAMSAPALPKLRSNAPAAAISGGRLIAYGSKGPLLNAASILRFPAGYDSDTAF